jgi:DNA-binding GntR family transcriptional regulator
VTPQRIDELVRQACARGEELTPAQAEKWLNQFAAIHRYVCTHRINFLMSVAGPEQAKASVSKNWWFRVFRLESRDQCSPAGQIVKDMKALADALKAKDTKAAQASMLKLQMDNTSASASPATSTQSTNPLSKVTSALNSGDMASAKKEFATFESNASAAFNNVSVQRGAT